jgi:ATP-dependent RNA helicase DDX55/SPB4
MTDADALSELVRVGLRNPARIVVKVQSKKKLKANSAEKYEIVEERRVPARSEPSTKSDMADYNEAPA